MKATIFRVRGGFKWRIRSRNGKIVATCGGELYGRARDAVKTLLRIRAGTWKIDDWSGT